MRFPVDRVDLKRLSHLLLEISEYNPRYRSITMISRLENGPDVLINVNAFSISSSCLHSYNVPADAFAVIKPLE